MSETNTIETSDTSATAVAPVVDAQATTQATKNALPHSAAPFYMPVDMKFSFKKQTIKDDLGAEVKRPPVTVSIPLPTYDGFVNELTNEETGNKVAQFVLDLVHDAIKDQVRSQLSDEEKPAMRQEDLDLSKLTLTYIANIPKSERTGGGISKEVWADFEKDYTEVMATVRGADKAAKAAKLFVSRFSQVRTDKPVLKFLRDELNTWVTKTTQVDDFQEVYTYLDGRVSDLLNKDNTSQLTNLM